MSDILQFFPLPKIRTSQEAVLKEIETAFKNKYKFIVLEAPVGSGKSAIAVTVAKWLKMAHILTPRKSLQDQYYEDFKKDLVLMKGRSSYICTYDSDDSFYHRVIKWVESGKSPLPDKLHGDCFNSPCRDKLLVYERCTTKRDRTCPYKRAIEIAEENDIIVHNFHSFLYQYNFAMRFNIRPVLIVDEAHEMEGILRDFATVEFIVPKLIPDNVLPEVSNRDLDYWIDYFQKPELQPTSTKRKEEYEMAVDSLKRLREFGTGYIVSYAETHHKTTLFKFVPIHVAKEAQNLIFSCADTVLLMSGTIYNKEVYCKSLGIKPEEAYFIRIPSTFPLDSRPIICKPEYLVDTSHSCWEDNKEEIASIVNTILEKFPDAKGLIHAPSYKACSDIKEWTKNKRLVTHTPENFVSKLEEFYKSSDVGVFLSPTCYQGVDFKQDRARFQIILRVPYLNTADEFTKFKVENDFPWYNHQALISFGQQTGRINRSPDDFGITVLVDSRFPKFINRNSKVLPKWLKDSIKYR